MGVPICLTQEDLKAGKVDVAILGAPIDMSTGQRGAAYGPRYIRADERIIPNVPAALQNPDTRVKPFEVLTVVDYGDAAVDPFSIEASMAPIRELVREVAETGAIPFVLGGDHSILWPDAAAVADVHGPGNVGVLHLDTHADCGNKVFGHLVTHGTPIRRLIEDEHIPARNFVQIGLHSFVVPDDELLGWMRKKGMRSHHMAEINRLGFDAVLEKAIAEALDGPKFLYLSLDIDVLDPAFAPGTGTPEPGGLTPRELLPAIRRLCHETPVVGFEVVEVAPHLDPGYTTALYARRAILEALTGIAQRKLGIQGKNYLDPVTSGTVPFSEAGA
jgi:agmatinase